LFLLVGLEEWHKPAFLQRQRQTKFEAIAHSRHTPRRRGVQYAAAAVVDRDAGVYWIIRWSLSSGGHSADPVADDDGCE